MSSLFSSEQDSVFLLYDTSERHLKAVSAQDSQRVRFYCCGPTVYGPAHIGNFRTFVAQDLLRRVGELSGFSFHHVRNLTDVDDKTIRQAQVEKMRLEAFTQQWIKRFHDDSEKLNILPPTVEPKAVEHIPEQIHLIEQLIKKGHAYQGNDGSVYFRIASFTEYGKLSGLHNCTLQSAGRQANQTDEYEKDALADFALWKARKPEDGPHYWESPWGEGRPGWHIECSAMGMKYLGNSFDLHSGGVDLTFPHHENEIAQSEAATGQPFVRHWVHVAHLLVDGEKMSKSKGNLYTVEAIQKKGYTPDELRYVLLMGHYRQTFNFSFQSLGIARQSLQRLSRLRQWLCEKVDHQSLDYQELLNKAPEERDWSIFQPVYKALLKDLNTSEALGQLFTVVKFLEKPETRDQFTPSEAAQALSGLSLTVAAFGWQLPVCSDEKKVTIPPAVQAIAERRWQAKQEKNWSVADALRDTLTKEGWQVMDKSDHYLLVPLE